MDKSGPIILIDDDLDDQVLLNEIFKELNVQNEVVYFANGVEAYAFLKQSPKQPFLILVIIVPRMVKKFVFETGVYVGSGSN